MRILKKSIAAALACLSLSALADVNLVAGEVPPFVLAEGGGKGVAYELLKEMAKRVGHKGAIALQPFVRALEAPKTDANAMVIPVGRNDAREKNYKWVVKLMDEEFLIVTSSKSQADISSFDSAKALKAGVMRGSVGERIAKDKGFSKLEDVPQEEVNAKKLDGGRIDVWVGAWNTMLNAQRAAGLKPEGLRRGAVAQKVGLYLAAAPGFDDGEAKKWADALEAMKKDGSYERILKAYHYELPKS